MCKHPGDVFVFFFFVFFSSDFSRANELQLDVLFFKSSGSSGSSISPSSSLAASYPALLHPKTKKTFHKADSSSSSQEALVPATRRSNRRRPQLRRRSKKRRRAYREGNKERQRQRETHTRSVAALSLLAVSVLPRGYCSSIHHDFDEVCLFFRYYCLSFFYCCILSS